MKKILLDLTSDLLERLKGGGVRLRLLLNQDLQ